METYAISKPTTFFTLRYSAAIRIWHWLTFLLMAASMVTVLFAETLFEPERENAPRNGGIQQTEQRVEREEEEGELREVDRSRLDPQTRAALTYRHKIWEAHKIIGFVLCFLLVSRLVIELSSSKGDRLLTRINKALSIPVQSKDEKDDKRHFLLVKSGYLVFYVLFTIMAVTGLILAFEHTPSLKALQGPSREVHEVVQYLLYAYIVAHLVGVIRSDLQKQKGIVSAMINGGV